MLRSTSLFRPLASRIGQYSTAEKAQVVKLNNRSVIRLAGEESRDFLQGLITNDIHHLSGAGSSIYSLFLNKAGRVLYDAVLYGSDNPGEVFVETGQEIGKELRKHMMIYRIRRKISIDLVDDEYCVWSVFGGDQIKSPNSCSDPRVKELGQRILLKGDGVTLPGTVGSLNDYNQLRYRLGVGEGVKEIVPGKAFPLEMNCDYMHGLSVHKGCYLGQEFTARTYHTGVVRKRIMPVEIKGSLPLGEDLLNKEVVTENGKAGGKIKAFEGEIGIGLLRIESVLASTELLVNKTVPIRTWKPSWWPVAAVKGGE